MTFMWIRATLTVMLVVALLTSSGAAAQRAARGIDRRPAAATFSAVVATPSPGDVSYGVARIRIGGIVSAHPLAGQRVFAGRIGGLEIVARSSAWMALRRTTRVYVAVSTVAGDPTSRDVAFFIVRRRAGHGSARAGGAVTFSIPNAQPATGSFWVRGIDRRGRAEIFEVRDILSTALGNWTRYLSVLRAAHALAAALHPLELRAGRPAGGAGGKRSAGGRLWTGGQRPDRRTRAVFALIVSALGDPHTYAEAKTSPIVTDFIARELNNPGLARRWRSVTGELPLQVPDRYAAAAQEESRFTKVLAPRISRSAVALDTYTNSSDQLTSGMQQFPRVIVTLVGTGSGEVTGQSIDCGAGHHQCVASFPPFAGVFLLRARPAPGSTFVGWPSCPVRLSNPCEILDRRADVQVTARFDLAPNSLTVVSNGGGSGTVTSSPAGIDCGRSCATTFAAGSQVTLTATPDPGSAFTGWAGCDSTARDTCTVTISAARVVTVTFQLATVRLDVIAHGRGRVTSSPGGIDCPTACEASFPGGTSVTLRATGERGWLLGSWDGCGSASGGACTVSLDADATVYATFVGSIDRLAGDLNFPTGVTVDAGNVYVADSLDNEVRRIASAGTITRVAGNGSDCPSAPDCGDNGPAIDAELNQPQGVAVDGAGNVYIADTVDNEIRKVAQDGTITRFAGDGTRCTTPPSCGDNGPATSAQLNRPYGVAVDAAANVYIADTADNEIRRVAPDGTITRIGGNGHTCRPAPACGDGPFPLSAELSSPEAVAVDAAGNVYIADTYDHEIREIANGTITAVAGSGGQCMTRPSCGNEFLATSAQLSYPGGIAVDATGNVYVADTADQEIREFFPGGSIFQIAGDGTFCTTRPDCGDGGPATSGQLSFPHGVAVDSAGRLYIGDSGDNEVRSVG